MFADTTLQTALLGAGFAPLITGLLVFFDMRRETALLYGPQAAHRRRAQLLRGGAYAVAHHATLMSAQLLGRIRNADGSLYCENISYGEDMDLTMRLVRAAGEDELKCLDQPMMFKFAGDGTISETSKQRRIWRDMRLVFERNPELSRSLLRRLGVDLMLRNHGRMMERARRRWGFPAGQVGFEEPVDYAPARRRMLQLDEWLAASQTFQEIERVTARGVRSSDSSDSADSAESPESLGRSGQEAGRG